MDRVFRLSRQCESSGPPSSLSDGRSELSRARSAQIVKQDHEIANERLLQRLAQKIIAIAQQFVVKGIEETLVDRLTRSE